MAGIYREKVLSVRNDAVRVPLIMTRQSVVLVLKFGLCMDFIVHLIMKVHSFIS